MMQPKRILTVLLVVVLLTFCSLTVLAAEADVPTAEFAVSTQCDTAILGGDGSYSYAKGDVVKFTVSLDSCVGEVGSLWVQVTYNSEYLEKTSGALAPAYDGFGAIGPLTFNSQTPEEKIFEINMTAYKGTGTLATFEFTVLADHADALVAVQAMAIGPKGDVPENAQEIPTNIGVHAYGEQETTQPDCLNVGETYRACTVEGCGAKLVLETKEALGHDYSGAPATCTTPQICPRENCGVILEEAGHDYSGPDADCTNAKVCARGCGVVLTPALGHDYSGPDADCLNPELCVRCNVTLVAALGHDESGPDADCTNDKFCAREGCGAQLKVRLGHDYSGAPATCTTNQVCVREGCSDELVAALGHEGGAAATCTTAQVCVRCNVEIVGALGHDESGVATCTGDKLCARPGCGVKLGDKLGHDESGEDATCKADKKCLRCGYVLEKKLEEHSFGAWNVIEKPTMSAEGKQTRTCSICGDVEEEKLDKKSSTWLIILIIVLVLVLAGGGFAAYWFLAKNKKADTESEDTTNEDSAEAPEETTQENTEE